jgi:thymidine kinase
VKKYFPIKVQSNNIRGYFGDSINHDSIIKKYIQRYLFLKKKIITFNFQMEQHDNIKSFFVHDLKKIIQTLSYAKYDLIIINQTDTISTNRFYPELQTDFSVFNVITAENNSQILFFGRDIIDDVPNMFSSLAMGIADKTYKTNSSQNYNGMLKVITGPMYSDKTTSLIEDYDNLCEEYQNDKEKCENKIFLVKPCLDARNPIISDRHGRQRAPNLRPNTLAEIVSHIKKYQQYEYILIDEVQFLNFNQDFKTANQLEIQSSCRNIIQLLKRGINFFIYGLDQNFKREPFLTTSLLMAISDQIVKLKAICNCCHEDSACHSQKISQNKKGSYDPKARYAALCRKCYQRSDISLVDIFDDPLLV